MRMVGAEYGIDLRGPTVCEVIDRAQSPTWWPESARPAAPRRRPRTGVDANQRVAQADRRAADGSGGDRGIGNVYRNELLSRHRIDPYRPEVIIGADEFDAMWTDLVALMKVGTRRGKMMVVQPTTTTANLYAPRGRAPMSTAAPATRAGSAEPRCAPRSWKRRDILLVPDL